MEHKKLKKRIREMIEEVEKEIEERGKYRRRWWDGECRYKRRN